MIAPLYAGEEQEWLRPAEGDLVICADGGYDAAVRWGFRPDLTVGDFDSMPLSHVREGEILRLPVHKDDTDMAVCLAQGRARGFRAFRLAGCIGGRLDHTLANLQCLYDCALRGEDAWMADRLNRVTVLTPGEHVLPAIPGRHLSLLSMTPETTGVTLRGAAYPLQNATLTNRFPLGVSNEFEGGEAVVSFASGALTALYTTDDTFGRK